MDVLITILSLLGVLIVLVMVHECGHFFTARAFGVRVEEFGLFFPPRLYGFKRGDTLYSINALPIGGFVKMAGEEDPDVPGSLAGKKPWIRIIVLAAGSIMNAILPVVLFSLAFMIPHNVLSGDVVVVDVAADSPAEQAGIVAGDTVLSLNDEPVRNIGDWMSYLQLGLGQEIDVTVEHADTTRENFRMLARWQPPEGEGATGMEVSVGPVLVDYIAADSPAEQAGLEIGDIFRSVRGVETTNVYEFMYYLYYDEAGEEIGADENILFVVERDGNLRDISVSPLESETGEGLYIGMDINGPLARESYPFWEAIPMGVTECYDTYVLFKNTIISMIVGTEEATIAGPVGIAQLTGEAARAGFSYLLQFAAFFSINLAIINIFPLPALDGGRIAFALLEWVRRGKRVSPRVEGIVHTVGFFLLIAAMVAITFQDIGRVITGGSVIP